MTQKSSLPMALCVYTRTLISNRYMVKQNFLAEYFMLDAFACILDDSKGKHRPREWERERDRDVLRGVSCSALWRRRHHQAWKPAGGGPGRQPQAGLWPRSDRFLTHQGKASVRHVAVRRAAPRRALCVPC